MRGYIPKKRGFIPVLFSPENGDYLRIFSIVEIFRGLNFSARILRAFPLVYPFFVVSP